MKQITEDYVSFEIAQLLKEKGFDVPTMYFFSADGNKIKFQQAHYIDDVARPTQSIALKWLREVHNLYIEIRRNLNTFYYGWKVEQGMSEKVVFDYKYDSYEQAIEAVLKFTLENLI